jgi:hypothetical protein
MKLSVLRDVVVYRAFKKRVGKQVAFFSFRNVGRLFCFDISFNHHFYHICILFIRVVEIHTSTPCILHLLIYVGQITCINIPIILDSN